jgi:hypothetical protein
MHGFGGEGKIMAFRLEDEMVLDSVVDIFGYMFGVLSM